jgi:predicted PurR-regulated permease PerM
MNEEPAKPSAPAKGDAKIAGRAGGFVLAAATIVGIVLCVLLTTPFLGALAWALSLAILFAPFHAKIEARLKYPNVGATVSILTVALIVAVPATFVVQTLVSEAATGAALVQAQVESGAVQRIIDAHPSIAPLGRWLEQQIDLSAMMASLATWLSGVGVSLVRGSVVQAIEVVLTFYLLFYFLRDGEVVRRLLRDLLPLTHAETDRLFGRVADTVHATIFGTVAVSAVQGTLGGLMFWFLGLPAPLLWGVVMGLLSIVPVLGAFVVWIPTAILLALDGSTGKALILAVWGPWSSAGSTTSSVRSWWGIASSCTRSPRSSQWLAVSSCLALPASSSDR